MADYLQHPASFRDPSGFIFYKNGNYYRQVNHVYAADYELLMSSGLYTNLVEKKKLIPHQAIDENFTKSPDWYKTLLPQQISFISYPFEWSFNQLKDAAQLSLAIMKTAMAHGMILKDASPFNVQFYEGRPVFIDSLSFEKYDASKPWVAYRQFCEFFLFPLLLGHYLKIDLQQLLAAYPDGVPVMITAKLLPAKSRFSLSVWLHVFLQNTIGTKKQPGNAKQVSFNKEKLARLIDHLDDTIKSLRIQSSIRSTWNNYYDETILKNNYLEEKEKIFREFILDMNPHSALDIGCNDGYFSRIIAEKGAHVVAVDFDSQCINKLYLSVKNNAPSNILPLCIDISNPSPASGFRNEERASFVERAPSDLVVALAIVHHLVLNRNIPLPGVVAQLAYLAKKYLIIEFVPLNDEKSQQLIANKKNYHTPYDAASFENYFSSYFEIEKKQTIPGTERILYRMKKGIRSGA